MSAALRGAVSPAVVVDEEGRIAWWNQAFEASFDWIAEPLAGVSIWDTLVLEEEAAPMRERFSRLAAGEDASDFESEWRGPSGSRGRIHWSPLRARRGRRRRHVLGSLVVETPHADERDGILAGRLLQAGDLERKRLASSTHSGLVQQIATLKLELSLLAREASMRDSHLADCLRKIQDDAWRAAESARQLCNELFPDALQHLGFVRALRACASEIQQELEVFVSVEAPASIAEPPAEIATQLYWIAREAARNAARHSRSDRVTIEVSTESHSIELEVRDWGRGFRPSDVSVNGTIGVGVMKERARIIGAKLKIYSEIGKGARVAVKAEWSRAS
jgi:PAS domain S-box-containing protein